MALIAEAEHLFPHNTVLRKLSKTYTTTKQVTYFPHNTVLRKLKPVSVSGAKTACSSFHTTLFYGNVANIMRGKILEVLSTQHCSTETIEEASLGRRLKGVTFHTTLFYGNVEHARRLLPHEADLSTQHCSTETSRAFQRQAGEYAGLSTQHCSTETGASPPLPPGPGAHFPHNTVLRKLWRRLFIEKRLKAAFHTTLFYGNYVSRTPPLLL